MRSVPCTGSKSVSDKGAGMSADPGPTESPNHGIPRRDGSTDQAGSEIPPTRVSSTGIGPEADSTQEAPGLGELPSTCHYTGAVLAADATRSETTGDISFQVAADGQATHDDALAPLVVPGFEIRGKIGGGGMGVVYKA